MSHEVTNQAEFAETCRQIGERLEGINNYLDDGGNLTLFEAMWFCIVAMEYHRVINNSGGGGGSDFRVDDTLY